MRRLYPHAWRTLACTGALLGRIGAPMLVGFNWEVHAWVIPLTFATGWVIGARIFKDQLRRRHPDLYEEWLRRAHPNRDKGES